MSCKTCKFRAKYDSNPQSFVGRIWRWHIGFCPGWKKYFTGLSKEDKLELSKKYNLSDT